MSYALYKGRGSLANVIQGGPKMAPFLYALTLPNINRFQNYFTVRIRRKFVIILSLKIPPHSKCVACLLYTSDAADE